MGRKAEEMSGSHGALAFTKGSEMGSSGEF